MLFRSLLTIVIVAAFARVVLFAVHRGYLPQPFFYAPSDTFADWFNPSHWARVSGTYGTYASLYPPLSFVLLRILGLDRCYDHSAVDYTSVVERSKLILDTRNALKGFRSPKIVRL